MPTRLYWGGFVKRNLALFQTLALVLLSTGCSDDEDDVVLPDGQVVFADLDDNDDGLISVAEYNGYFSDWDVNDDGLIDPYEWSVQTVFTTIDTNGDGYIDNAEYVASFAALDANGDGYLDANELLFD
jgi:Ca2+-binding EF-hand superfamily protein